MVTDEQVKLMRQKRMEGKSQDAAAAAAAEGLAVGSGNGGRDPGGDGGLIVRIGGRESKRGVYSFTDLY